MIRSMYSGVAGLRNHQLKMDVLGNNIANVNTYGYKASRTSFADMFSQTLSPATGANGAGTLGGINTKQVGLGSLSSAIDVIHSAGAFQSTDRTLDLTIIDEGFFTVTDGPDTYYTRSGNLYLDSFGYLVTVGGQYVMGKMLIGQLEPEDGEASIEESLAERIENDPDIMWDDTPLDEILEDLGDEYPYYLGEDETIAFGEEGPWGFGRIVVPPYFRQIAVDEAGVVKGIDNNGNEVNIAVLVTTTFLNPGGLTKVGDNFYMESSNSGKPAYGYPGVGPNGSFKVGGLEMSNVDLANEFTTMIVTQRGYQSNSRVITVSDTLLEELINLKR